MTDDPDLFDDDFVSARQRQYSSADEILETLEAESADTKKTRHAKHTRKPRKSGPEAQASKRIRTHLEKHYGARVLRTNAGFVRDEAGNTIQLGEAGQSDLHAIIPIQIDSVVFGVFAAIEVKAGSNTPTDRQTSYLESIERRGGIAVVAYSVLDIDTAVAAYRSRLVKMLSGLKA